MSVPSKAVVFVEKNKVEVRTIELPAPQDDEILVKTLFSGVSAGTELWSLTGQYWSTVFPTVPGYQKTGVVEQVGSKVLNYKKGDVIFLRSTRVSEHTNIEWGGHTECSVVRADEPEMFCLPAGLAPEEASLLCMPAIGYHGAAEVMPIENGQWVAVIGLGLIGQFSAQAASLCGAKVIAIDLIDARLKAASELAGAVAINPSTQDPAKAIRELCPDGLDAVIDTSAHAQTVNQSFHWLRNKGSYCLQGYYPGLTSLDLLWPHAKELTFYNPTNCTPEGERACAEHLACGKMHMKPLISHVVPVADAPAMYDMLLNRRQQSMGVVFDWRK